MINIIFEPALLLGGIFAFFMIGLYSLRFINPQLATDWDIFIATLGIVYSSIIVIHGWRLDPILLFSQVLLIFISFSFCWILIRQREIIRILLDDEKFYKK
jgi:Mn2+/Fe2+ NRAMP family transporter